jgi:diguanylate cyclase (GGDEF)-like protein/PAS domain S-box-containing protein
MPLKKKSFLTLLISLIVSIAVLFGTASYILIKSYAELEEVSTIKDLERLDNTYKALVNQMKRTSVDWAYWDDTYQFILDNNQDYIDSNLMDETLFSLRINLFQVVDNQANTVFTKFVYQDKFGVHSSNVEKIDVRTKYPAFLESASENPQKSGIVELNDQKVLIISAPVIHSDYSGPKVGTLLMGRILDQEFFDQLSEQTGTSIYYFPYPINDDLLDLQKPKMELENGDIHTIKVINGNQSAGYTLLRDMNGVPAAILQVKLTRDIYHQGINTLYYLFSILLLLVLIVLVVFYFLLDKLFFKRILNLSKDIQAINKLKRSDARISSIAGDDEISSLGESINTLLSTLDKVQESYKLIVQNQGEGLTIVNENEVIKFVNPAAENIFHVLPGELVGRSLKEFLNKEDIEKLELETRQRKNGIKSSYELNIHVSDGSVVPILITATPQFDASGNFLASYGIFRDISEIKNAQTTLVESESKFRSFIEQTLVGIFLLDEKGTVIEWNRSLEKLTGLQKKDAINQSYNDVLENMLPHENRSERLNKLIKLIYSRMMRNNGKASNFPILELSMQNSAGCIVIADMLTFPINTSRGIMVGGIFYDKTEQKNMEKSEKDQRTFIEALLDTSEGLNSTLDLDTLLDRILENTDRVLSSDTGAILLLEKGSLKVIRGRGYIEKGYGDITLNPPFRINERQNMNDMFESGLPMAIPDTSAYPGWIPLPENAWAKSYIGVPLKIHEKVIGFISLFSAEKNYYSIIDSERLKPFANQAAIALENARLYSATQLKAETDELTGLKNRRNFFEMGAREVERAARFNHALSVLMIDLDGFKEINDTFGHPVGDRLLKELADVLKSKLRNVDLIARYGGDEFIILLPENDSKGAIDAAERICRNLEQVKIETAQGMAKVTASVGVASLGDTITTLSGLIEQADRALYTAKKFGKNRVVAKYD